MNELNLNLSVKNFRFFFRARLNDEENVNEKETKQNKKLTETSIVFYTELASTQTHIYILTLL